MAVAAAHGITIDSRRDEVITELGNPTSHAVRGTREILLYPKGVRIELDQSRVVAAQGISLTATPHASPPVASTEKPVPPPPPASRKPEPAKTEVNDYGEPQAPAKPPAGLEKSLDALLVAQAAAPQRPPAPTFDLQDFTLGLLLKLLMTLAALKIACKYWGAEVFSSGLWIVAAVESAIRAGLNLAAEVWLGAPTLFYADELVSGIVMVILLKKLSINQSTTQALQLTLTAKTFTVVVGSFLVTVILRLFHSH